MRVGPKGQVGIPISNAGAFAVVTPRHHHATSLTGDPEILALSGETAAIDLRRS
jgi:hypothetical protein